MGTGDHNAAGNRNCDRLASHPGGEGGASGESLHATETAVNPGARKQA